MGLLWTILIGFVVGSVARFLVPGKDPAGFILTTVLGICGSWVGAWLSGMIGFGPRVGFIGSVIGAVVILLVFRFLRRRD